MLKSLYQTHKPMPKRRNPIGDFLRVTRAQMRISQEEITKRTGITQSTISMIESGGQKAQDETLIAIMTKAFRMTDTEAELTLASLKITEIMCPFTPRQSKVIFDKLPYV